MVTRKSQSRKEKRTMATFGQFILPLTVIMAFALLFFSIKLFFLDPKEIDIMDDGHVKYAHQPSVSNTESELSADIYSDKTDGDNKIIKDSVPKTTNANTVKKTVVKKPSADTSGEVKKTVSSNTAAAEKKQAAASTETKTVKRDVAQTTASAEKKTSPAKADAAGADGRWDIQIGGFSAKEGALETMKKARSEGYQVYITESVMNDKPFYKVRVKGSAEKSAAAKMSSEIASKGYPVYIVYNK